jgi:alpha-L-glutamate ligase-like protein
MSTLFKITELLPAKKLAEKGVLGINRRNAEYTLNYNPRHLYTLVDDKLRTKHLASEAGIRVPELYGLIETEYQVRQLSDLVKRYNDFALKPSRGSGGRGIMVIVGRSKDLYRDVGGSIITQDEISHHVHNILSGMYSLGGQPDKTLIEYRVHFDPVFEAISYQGVPDIRIIVFLGVPVMSMVRLPTRMSGGKANLHQGAIGAGIDIQTGVTLSAVWRDRIVMEHPDTGNYELTGLGYIGVDLVLDKEKGPLILELNARPGLNIQIANRAGLYPRLKLTEQHHGKFHTVDERVSFAVEHFSAQ